MKTHSCLIAILLAATPAFAQKAPSPPEPPELIASRAEYMRAMSRVSVQPLSTYLRTLEPLKQQFLRAGKSEAALAVDAEIKSIKEQLQVAETASNFATARPLQAAAGATVKFQLENVMYGDPATRRMKDVTDHVRAAMDSGQPTMQLANRNLGGDPAKGVEKTVIVTYSVNSNRKHKTFTGGATIDFKKDLR